MVDWSPDRGVNRNGDSDAHRYQVDLCAFLPQIYRVPLRAL